MGQLVVSDNAVSVLAAPLTASPAVNSAVLVDGTKFPVVNQGGVGSDWSYITFYDASNNMERVKVTRHDNGSNTVSIARGSAAGISGNSDSDCKAWASTTTGVACRLIAQTVNDIGTAALNAASSASAAATSASNAAASAALAPSYATANTFPMANATGNGWLYKTVSQLISLFSPNAANGLVQLDSSNKYPALDGSAITNINSVAVGSISIFPQSSAPSGYLKLNGALLSRTTYAALWAYAQASGNLAANDGAWQAGQFSPGDGSTTFRIPDYRGEFLRMWDDGKGTDAGRGIGQWQAQDTQPHNHSITDPGHYHSYYYGSMNGYAMAFFGTSAAGSGTTTSATTGITVNNSTGTETRPRNVAALACIKY